MEKVKFRSVLDKLHGYVPGKSIDEVKSEHNLDKVIKLASNENPLGPSPKVIEALTKQALTVSRYPLGSSPQLIKSLAEKLNLKPSNICIGNGSDELIWTLSTIFLDSEDEVISSQPTFSEYDFCTKLLGANYIDVPVSPEWNHQLDLTLAAITDKTKMIYICNPNNPTGTWLKYAEIIDFLDKVPKNIVVVVDQAYCEYAIDEPDYPMLEQEVDKRGNLVLLRTFSKAYALAGLRIGYSIAGEEITDALMKVKQPFNVNLMAQTAALVALNDEEHLQQSLKLNRDSKKKIIEYLDSKGLEHLPTLANFIAVNFEEEITPLVNFLESKGVIVRGLKPFGMNTWIRISFGNDYEMSVLIKLLDQWLNDKA